MRNLVLIALVLAMLPVYAQPQGGGGESEAAAAVGPAPEDAAQPPEGTPPQDGTPAEGQPPGEGEPEEAPEPPPEPEGDTLIMKSGAEFTGVQVIQETPMYYKVQLVPSTVVLDIPRKRVESVVYDAFEPARGGIQRRTSPQEREPVLLPGKAVSPELMPKLRADIGEPAEEMTGKDFILILEEAGKRADVSIGISSDVAIMPPQSRNWSYVFEPGSNMMAIIDALVGKFPDLSVSYEGNTVFVKQRKQPADESEEAAAETEGPEEGAPAASAQ